MCLRTSWWRLWFYVRRSALSWTTRRSKCRGKNVFLSLIRSWWTSKILAVLSKPSTSMRPSISTKMTLSAILVCWISSSAVLERSPTVWSTNWTWKGCGRGIRSCPSPVSDRSLSTWSWNKWESHKQREAGVPICKKTSSSYFSSPMTLPCSKWPN